MPLHTRGPVKKVDSGLEAVQGHVMKEDLAAVGALHNQIVKHEDLGIIEVHSFSGACRRNEAGVFDGKIYYGELKYKPDVSVDNPRGLPTLPFVLETE